MTTGFRRRRDGSYVVRLDPSEAGVLHTLFSELVAMLDDGGNGAADSDDPIAAALGGFGERERPADPALARLLPDAYADDEEASAEFRRYTEGDLRAGKIEAARTAKESLGAGGKIELTEEQAQAWLGVLNDLRLTLGTRLDVTEDHDDVFPRLPDEDPRKQAWYVYSWLSYLQQSLVEALMDSL